MFPFNLYQLIKTYSPYIFPFFHPDLFFSFHVTLLLNSSFNCIETSALNLSVIFPLSSLNPDIIMHYTEAYIKFDIHSYQSWWSHNAISGFFSP